MITQMGSAAFLVLFAVPAQSVTTSGLPENSECSGLRQDGQMASSLSLPPFFSRGTADGEHLVLATPMGKWVCESTHGQRPRLRLMVHAKPLTLSRDNFRLVKIGMGQVSCEEAFPPERHAVRCLVVLKEETFEDWKTLVKDGTVVVILRPNRDVLEHFFPRTPDAPPTIRGHEVPQVGAEP